MGWFGYGVYDGDGTATRHYDFLKWSDTFKNDDEIDEADIFDYDSEKTVIPKNKIKIFKKGTPNLLKKMPKVKNYWNEDSAIEWQMLLALFIDNKIKPPMTIYLNGVSATNYLMGDHAADFNEPSKRRNKLRTFLRKAEKLGVENE